MSAKEPATVSRRRDPALTRSRILTAATELFLQEGYSRTSLEAVAAAAEVTKPTVYSHFQSKRELFRSVIHESANERLESIGQLKSPTGDPRTDLIQFGDAFLSIVLSGPACRWDRLAAAESIQHPEVGELFYEAGPRRVLGLLSSYLRSQKKAGRLAIAQCDRAAEQLIGLLLGVDHLRTQIGHPIPSTAVRKRRCREAVSVFLKAYEVSE